MVKRVAPISYEAWIDYQVMGDKLSRGELRALARLVAADEGGVAARPDARLSDGDLGGLGLSKREIRELKGKLAPRDVPDFRAGHHADALAPRRSRRRRWRRCLARGRTVRPLTGLEPPSQQLAWEASRTRGQLTGFTNWRRPRRM